MEKCIPLSEALCGVSAFVVNHLDGRHIRLLRKAGDVIKPGKLGWIITKLSCCVGHKFIIYNLVN
jgi:hypothetical protein